jgi:TP901 family phage tail tape measure protein
MIGASGSGINILVRMIDATRPAVASVSAGLGRIRGSALAASTAVRGILAPLIGIGITVAVARFVTSTVRTFAAFDDAMRAAGAVTGATADEMLRMSEIAQDMGRTTRYTAAESAEALKFLGMAGFSAAQSIEALPGVLELAAAGSLDLGTAADIATNVLTAFGLEANRLGAVNDVLVKAFTSANVTLGELGDSFRYVGPIARGVGAEFEDLIAAIARLGDAGIKGSMAGTALRGSLAALLDPTKQEADMMKLLGERIGQTSIEVFDAEKNFVGFVRIVEQLERAGLRGEEALGLFGLRAGPGMAALVAIGSKKLRELKEELDTAQGTAARVAEAMEKGIGGAMRRAKSAMEGFKIAIGEAFGDEIQILVEKIAGLFLDLIVTIKRLQTDGTLERWKENIISVMRDVSNAVNWTYALFMDLYRITQIFKTASRPGARTIKELDEIHGLFSSIGKERKKFLDDNKAVVETYFKIDKATGQVIETTEEWTTALKKQRREARAALQEQIDAIRDPIGRSVSEIGKDIREEIKKIFDSPAYEAYMQAGLIKVQAVLNYESEKIKGQYDQGKIDLDQYFIERAKIVERRIESELKLMQARKDALEVQVEILDTGEDKVKALNELEILNAQIVAKHKELQTQLLSLTNERIGDETRIKEGALRDEDRINKIRLKLEEDVNRARLRAEQAFLDQKERLEIERAGGGLETQFMEEIANLQKRQNREMELIREHHNKQLEALIDRKATEEEIERVSAQQAREILEQKRMQDEEKSRLEADQLERAAELRLKSFADMAGGMASILSDVYELLGKENKALFYAAKAAAIAEAMINTAVAVTKAYKEAGNPYVGMVMAGIIGAMGAVQIAKIASQNLAEGGLVKGKSKHSKADDKLIAATSGEFMQPVDTVRHYGLEVMEALRRKVVPREWFSNVRMPSVRYGFSSFAQGGAVSAASGVGGMATAIEINNKSPDVVVEEGDMRYDPALRRYILSVTVDARQRNVQGYRHQMGVR